MKKIFFILCCASLFFTACEKERESEGVTELTIFADVELLGEPLLFVDCNGGTFSDPGVNVTEQGATIPHETNEVGIYFGGSAVSADAPDYYQVQYSAENVDGFTGVVSREVYVACTGDMVNSLEGLYRTAGVRINGEVQDRGAYIIIRSAGGNDYEISDAIGGFYDTGRGFGPQYAALGGVITANDIAANDFTASTAVFPIWGNTIDISSMVVDPATKTITYTATGNFGNGEFAITLTQVSL